jgi:ATP-dependent exoDNAse (exonuclease V) alpha subunit
MIASGAIPVVRLTEVFRQAAESRIIVNAHRINQGVIPDLRKRTGAARLQSRRQEGQAKARKDQHALSWIAPPSSTSRSMSTTFPAPGRT